jgi:hypothetical protein
MPARAGIAGTRVERQHPCPRELCTYAGLPGGDGDPLLITKAASRRYDRALPVYAQLESVLLEVRDDGAGSHQNTASPGGSSR